MGALGTPRGVVSGQPTPRPVTDRADRLAEYAFRSLDDGVRYGTASDRYAGWVGQIYSEAMGERATSRKKRVGSETFEEKVLPVASVAEYFDHFDVLEIDYTFYVPLADREGAPTRTWHTLQAHTEPAPDHARFLLKAPAAFVAPGVRRGRGYEANPTYLDAVAYAYRFLEPARDVLGPRLAGVVVEQGYQRKGSSPAPEAQAAEIAGFFDAVNVDRVAHHLEVRSPHLLGGPLAAWLAGSPVGMVLSHWTWLPPLRRQWALAGPAAASASGEVVTRLLTPLRMRYADAYAQTHPFDRVVPEVAGSEQARAMVRDVVEIVREARERDVLVNLIANNRAYGNAPELVREVATRLGESAG